MKPPKPPHLKVMLVDEDPDRAADVGAALEANGCKTAPMLEVS